MTNAEFIVEQLLLEDDDAPRIRGEYWITDDGVWYADGDVGEMNHEMYARDYCARRILDFFNTEVDDEFIDEDSFREAIVEVLSENGIETDPKTWQEAARQYMSQTAPERKDLDAIFSGALGFGDVRDIAVQYLGWIWCRGNNFSMWTYDREQLLSGVNDIIEQEGGEPDQDWSQLDLEIFIVSSKRHFSVTFGQLESGRTPGVDPKWPGPGPGSGPVSESTGIFLKKLDSGREVYTCKCRCGNIHGGYRTYGEAEQHKKCRMCHRKEVEKTKKDIEKVDKPKKQKSIFQSKLNKPPHPAGVEENVNESDQEDLDVEAVVNCRRR